MGNIRHPRRGSLQYWPRKRAKHRLARIRFWPNGGKESKTKPLGFIGYKAGMTHVLAIDNHPKSLTKGESIAIPTTIIDCPPLQVAGAAFYKDQHKVNSFLSSAEKHLSRRIPLSKKPVKEFPPADTFDDVRLLVQTLPHQASDTKTPKLLEIALGGSKEEKIKYVQSMLGKEILVSDAFDAGNSVDVHGITKGKGFQGTVKRFGVPVRQHKAEKTKRGIATLGSWTPKRVEYSVAQPGKMGYHLRTEYNKQILKMASKPDFNPKGGIHNYGLLQHPYLLLKGSVMGPKKRAVVLTPSLRPNPAFTKEAPEITYTSIKS